MDTTKFSISSNGECKAAKISPDQKAIKMTLASSKKKYLQKSTVIIARYNWMKRNNISFPEGMELPNLCLTIKNGKLIRAIFSNVLTHVIKKQNYFIQILN
jgi:hypothetical protein